MENSMERTGDKVNSCAAAIVNTEISAMIYPKLIECLFFGIIDGKYQICKGLNGNIVLIFEDPKDAVKFVMSSCEKMLMYMACDDLNSVDNYKYTHKYGSVATAAANTTGMISSKAILDALKLNIRDV